MNYEIRKAKIEDLEQIKLLLAKLSQKEHDEFDETTNGDYAQTEDADQFLRQRIGDGLTGLCLVVEAEDKIVGYFAGGIVTNPTEDYRSVREIGEGESMFLEEGYRGKGIGTELLTFFEVWCKEKGLKCMTMAVSSGNKEAIKLYKSRGYEEYYIKLEKTL